MGKVDRLPNKVEPFAVLFWTPDPARQPAAALHRRTQSMSLYVHSLFNS